MKFWNIAGLLVLGAAIGSQFGSWVGERTTRNELQPKIDTAMKAAGIFYAAIQKECGHSKDSACLKIYAAATPQLNALAGTLWDRSVNKLAESPPEASTVTATDTPAQASLTTEQIDESDVLAIDPNLISDSWTQANMTMSPELSDVIQHHGGRCAYANAFRRFSMGRGIVVLCDYNSPEAPGVSYTLMLHPADGESTGEIDLIRP